MKLSYQLFKKLLVVLLIVLIGVSPLQTPLRLLTVTAAAPTITNLPPLDYQEGDGDVQVAPNIEITGGGSYGDGYVRFTITNSEATDQLSVIQSSSPSSEAGIVSIVGTTVYLGEGGSSRVIGTVNATYNGANGQPIQIDFSTPLVNAGFEEDVQRAIITQPSDMGAKHRINGWDITLDKYVVSPLESGTQGTLNPSYNSSFRMQFEVQASQKSTGAYALRLEAEYWVNETRGAFNLVQPNFAVFHGPWAISDSFYAYENDTIALDWSAVNGGDDYDVYAFLVNENTGVETRLFYGRGRTQAWTTTTASIPNDGQYRFKFISGSYDGTGGGLMGASLYIDNIRYFGNVISDVVVQQAARLITYSSNAPRHENTTKTIEIEVKNANEEEVKVTQPIKTEPLIKFADQDDSNHVSKDIELVTETKDGETITWSVDKPEFFDVLTGTITKPSFTTEDETIVLTATIEKDGNKTEKTFTLVIKKGEQAESINLTLQPFSPVKPGYVQLTLPDSLPEENMRYYRVHDQETVPLNQNQMIDPSGWTPLDEQASHELEATNGSYIEVVEVNDQNRVVKSSIVGPTDDGKPLQDAVEAAEQSLNTASDSTTRYESFAFDLTDETYLGLQTSQAELATALDAEPQNKENILMKAASLKQAILALEQLIEQKLLDQVLDEAEVIQQLAKIADARYQAAAGELKEQVYQEFSQAVSELEAKLTADPQNKEDILQQAKQLEEATKALEQASEAKELANALAAAEAALSKGQSAEQRYQNAGGDEETSVYLDYLAVKDILTTAIDTKPLDKQFIQEQTQLLDQAIAQLNAASEAKELANAIEAAETAIELAKQHVERHQSLNGEYASYIFDQTKQATEQLKHELELEQPSTETIIEQTNALLELAQLLDQHNNHFEAAQNAQKVSKAATEAIVNYQAIQGNQTEPTYVNTIQLDKTLTSLLETSTIEQTNEIVQLTNGLAEMTKKLNQEVNQLWKTAIIEQIGEIKTMPMAYLVTNLIEQAKLTQTDRADVFTAFVDKLLSDQPTVKLTRAKDIDLILQAIAKSNKSAAEQELAKKALIGKAILELSAADAPTQKNKFQQQTNQAIDAAILTLTNESNQTEMRTLHELYVDMISLTRDQAFHFADNDTWESITRPFITLNKGNYGSIINWSSTKPEVIGIANGKAITNRQQRDQSSILTATLTNGKQQIEKSFLLIVKSKQIGDKFTEQTLRPVNIGSNSNTKQFAAIERINLLDQSNTQVVNKINKLILTSDMVQEAGAGTIRIFLPNDVINPADELAVEVPANVLAALTGGLEIHTDYGQIYLSAEQIARLQATSNELYFRLVPVNEQGEQIELVNRALNHLPLQQELEQLYGKHGKINILGAPVEIETNYKGFETTIMLPLADVFYDGINLNNLRVYIEHSDGEIVVAEGELVYDEQGNPVGLAFTIEKFSTFTIIELAEEVTTPTDPDEEDGGNGSGGTPPNPGGGNGVGGNEGKASSDQDGDDNITVEDRTSEDSKEALPNTASSTFNWLIAGFVLMVSGVMLKFVKRKKV
ncbi:LPXTG cell wall anchor domain-containing protein [Amphibacillus marinus]|nr:LPXTG cell wall anchor domain-containing protein [Amphibacillus marinus]